MSSRIINTITIIMFYITFIGTFAHAKESFEVSGVTFTSTNSQIFISAISPKSDALNTLSVGQKVFMINNHHVESIIDIKKAINKARKIGRIGVLLLVKKSDRANAFVALKISKDPGISNPNSASIKNNKKKRIKESKAERMWKRAIIDFLKGAEKALNAPPCNNRCSKSEVCTEDNECISKYSRRICHTPFGMSICSAGSHCLLDGCIFD